MPKKTKVYVDTSVWNFALETIRPDSIMTYEFLQIISNQNVYDLFISELVDSEIRDAHQERKENLIRLIETCKPTILKQTNDAFKLAETYVSEKLIPEAYRDDAMHIAIATINRCEFLVSWNFKHIVRAKVIRGVHLINHRKGHGLIELVSPREFLGK